MDARSCRSVPAIGPRSSRWCAPTTPRTASPSTSSARARRWPPCWTATPCASPGWCGVEERHVGYVVVTLGFSLESGGRDGFIDELYIAPAARGRGIGAKVLALVEREAARPSV